MNKQHEKKITLFAQKISSSVKGRSQYKYFLFLVYVFIGSLLFYGSYKVNEKEIFYYSQYQLNQKFELTNNVSMYLRDINYSEKEHKLYLSFEDRRATMNIQKRDSYPITYRVKIIQGKLLPAKTYATVSNGFIVEIKNVPSDFKTMKVSLVLNDFEQTDNYNKDQAPFFYINNDRTFKSTQTFNGAHEKSTPFISLSKKLVTNLIDVKQSEIQNKQKNIHQLKEKIADYQQTKELPMNEKEERTITQIDSQIQNLEDQINQNQAAITRKEKQISTYKKNLTDQKLLKESIKELRFTYDIEKEKREQKK